MKHLRHLSGWLALLLGISGMLVCLLAVTGGWLWSFQLRGSIDRVSDQVTGFTARLSDRSDEASEWLNQSQRTITTLEQNVAASLDAALAERGVDPAEFDATVRQVRAAIGEVREWLAVAESSGAVAELIQGVVDSLGVLVSPELRGRTGEALAETLVGIKETGIAVEELSAAVDRARAGDTGAKQVRSILSQSASALASLQGHTDSISSVVDDVGNATLELRSRLHQRLTFLLVVGTGLLIWQAVAQWSLARWGGQLLRVAKT